MDSRVKKKTRVLYTHSSIKSMSIDPCVSTKDLFNLFKPPFKLL